MIKIVKKCRFFQFFNKLDNPEKVPKTPIFQLFDVIFTPVSLSIMIRDLESDAGGG